MVVIVEDERAIADLERLYLSRAGFGVHVASNGNDGLADIRRLSPVVAIIDVGLPGIDGIELLRRLRAADDWVPVVFVTAHDDEVDRILGLELGADDYLAKPFSPRELVARVKGLVRRSSIGTSTPVLRAAGIEVDERRPSRLDRRSRTRPDPDRVRPARLPACPARPGVQPRAAALGRLERRRLQRQPHRRRAHRPAAHEARRPDPIRTVRGVGYSLRGDRDTL